MFAKSYPAAQEELRGSSHSVETCAIIEQCMQRAPLQLERWLTHSEPVQISCEDLMRGAEPAAARFERNVQKVGNGCEAKKIL